MKILFHSLILTPFNRWAVTFNLCLEMVQEVLHSPPLFNSLCSCKLRWLRLDCFTWLLFFNMSTMHCKPTTYWFPILILNEVIGEWLLLPSQVLLPLWVCCEGTSMLKNTVRNNPPRYLSFDFVRSSPLSSAFFTSPRSFSTGITKLSDQYDVEELWKGTSVTSVIDEIRMSLWKNGMESLSCQ